MPARPLACHVGPLASFFAFGVFYGVRLFRFFSQFFIFVFFFVSFFFFCLLSLLADGRVPVCVACYTYRCGSVSLANVRLPACLSSSFPCSGFVFAGLFFVSFGRLKTNSEELLPNSLEETLRVMADDGRVNVTATR